MDIFIVEKTWNAFKRNKKKTLTLFFVALLIAILAYAFTYFFDLFVNIYIINKDSDISYSTPFSYEINPVGYELNKYKAQQIAENCKKFLSDWEVDISETIKITKETSIESTELSRKLVDSKLKCNIDVESFNWESCLHLDCSFFGNKNDIGIDERVGIYGPCNYAENGKSLECNYYFPTAASPESINVRWYDNERIILSGDFSDYNLKIENVVLARRDLSNR